MHASSDITISEPAVEMAAVHSGVRGITLDMGNGENDETDNEFEKY